MSEERGIYNSGGFRVNEKYLSQIPALQQLINKKFLLLFSYYIVDETSINKAELNR